MLTFVAVLLLYFLPTCIAAMRHHAHTHDIFLLNLVVGWTVFGWLVMVIWVAAGSPRD